MKNHPSDVVLEVDGKKGFISQRRGAVLHIIKCTSSDVSYRHIEEDTEEIPVFHKERPMFVDPISFVLKPNATKIKSGTYLPIKWKIGNTWYCKHGRRTACGAPSKFEPANGKTANMLQYDDLPLEGGILPQEEIEEHERTIFYDDSKKKALDELGDDILNLRPSRLSPNFDFDSIADILYDFFLEALSKGHTKLAIFFMFLYIFHNVFGFVGRCYHIYKTKEAWWKYLLVAPFHQIFALTVLPWKTRKETSLTDDEVSQIGKHVKINIEE